MAERILFVEDDHNLGSLLTEVLELKGYDVTHCSDGEIARDAFNSGQFDLCILDVMLPKMDGFTLGKIIRDANPKIPIIFLTAKSMKEDRIEGLTIGADDYVTKPFSFEELLLRIKAILKRTSSAPNGFQPLPILNIGNYRFDPEQRILYLGDEGRQLTHKESELLRIMGSSIGMIVKRSDVLKEVWGDDNYFNGRSMDVFVTRLRKYLKDDPNVLLSNIHGLGYKLSIVGQNRLQENEQN
jgi:DNA-binding response OmpR family regulator